MGQRSTDIEELDRVTGAVKVIYFAPKPHGQDLPAFRARWRRHSEVAMSLPMFRHMFRYEQCDRCPGDELDPALARVRSADAADLGGVGKLWLRDDEAAEAVFSDPDVAVMVKDEQETFGGPLGSALMATREQVLLEDGPTAFTIHTRLARRQGVTPEEFSDAWQELGRAIAQSPALSPHLRRVAQNRLLSPTEEADGVEELGFASLEDAAACVAEPAFAELVTGFRERFADDARTLSVVTSTTILYAE